MIYRYWDVLSMSIQELFSSPIVWIVSLNTNIISIGICPSNYTLHNLPFYRDFPLKVRYIGVANIWKPIGRYLYITIYKFHVICKHQSKCNIFTIAFKSEPVKQKRIKLYWILLWYKSLCNRYISSVSLPKCA